MKHDMNHSENQQTWQTSQNGVDKTLQGGVLRSLVLSILMVLACSFLYLSCEKEIMHYDEIKAYYAESLTLPEVTADSVQRFSHKVNSFVEKHPAAKEDPLYPEIISNINKVVMGSSFTVNEDWQDPKEVNF